MAKRFKTVDDREVKAFLKSATITEAEMLAIEKPMALTIVNNQRILVPKDTHATELSIRPDVQSSSPTEVIDHIGPSTNYAPSIEFGIIEKPNYPIQPFVRPTASGKSAAMVTRVSAAALKKLVRKKHG